MSQDIQQAVKEIPSDTFLFFGHDNNKYPNFIHAGRGINTTQPLPWSSGYFHGIFVEDFIESLSQADAIYFMRECHRILKPGGTLRISTLDLDAMIDDYIADRCCSNLEKLGVDWISNRCEGFNLNMGWGSSKYIYNEVELRRIAQIIGFDVCSRHTVDESDCCFFSDLEKNSISTLILEFVKSDRNIGFDESPLVSITIPAYNPEFFAAALDSALSQTYENIEIVITDDCPNDAIYEIADIRIRADNRIRYYKNPKRLLGGNMIRCIREAKGEFIKFLNDDDLLSPDCVSLMIEAFRKFPDVSFVTSHRQLIDASGKFLPDNAVTKRIIHKDIVIEGISLINVLVESRLNFVGEPTTAMFRKKEIEHIKPHFMAIDGKFVRILNDVATWLHLSLRGNVVFLNDSLSFFRQHPGQRQRDPSIPVAELAAESWTRLRGWRDRKQLARYCEKGILLYQSLQDKSQEWQKLAFVRGGLARPALGGNLVINSKKTPEELYKKWIKDREINPEPILFDDAQSKSIHVVIYVDYEQQNQLADTLDALGLQKHENWFLSVLSLLPCPDRLFIELPNLEWQKISSMTDLYQHFNKTAVESNADWLLLLPVGVYLSETVFLTCLKYINKNPTWRLIYTDDDTLDDNHQRCLPMFKPDFNIDYFRSKDYIGDAVFVQKTAFISVGGLDNLFGAYVFDLVLKIYDQFGELAIGHISEVLFHKPKVNSQPKPATFYQALSSHFERSQLVVSIGEGYLPNTFYIQYVHAVHPVVSIIIVVKSIALLDGCINSLLEKTVYQNYEVFLCFDAGDEQLNSYLNAQEHKSNTIKLLAIDNIDNYAAAINRAARQAGGEYFLVIDEDILFIQENWLDRLLSYAQRSDVGIVGPRLVFPDQTLQSSGLILGMGELGVAGYLNAGLAIKDPGYMGRAQVAQNFSAVSAVCLLIRKSVYSEINGLDDKTFESNYAMIDFSIKVRDLGYKIVWTPYSTVIKRTKECFGWGVFSAGSHTERADANKILSKWLPKLATDPAYSRHLSLKHRYCEIETKTDVTWNVDFHDRLRVYAFPANNTGVGEYRVRAPLRALNASGMVVNSLLPNHSETLIPDIVEIERAKPDVVLLQNGTADYLINAWSQYRKFNDVFMVYSQDDLVFALPGKHPMQMSGKWPKDMAKRLRKVMEQSDRLIVATEPLKEAYQRWISDIKLVPNYLEKNRWLTLNRNPVRRHGKKLRVGWAGGAQHHGDLELMIPVVEATKHEVDWVFMGMCLDAMRPHIREYHDGVMFDLYPQKLLDLDLDLAIAPLEYNNFNMAKTNLRVLEYGVLGWPVLCSDITPYRNAPVTLVSNNSNSWIKAIREKVNEPVALANEGQILKQWVIDHFLLEDHLNEWLDALTPP